MNVVEAVVVHWAGGVAPTPTADLLLSGASSPTSYVTSDTTAEHYVSLLRFAGDTIQVGCTSSRRHWHSVRPSQGHLPH